MSTASNGPDRASPDRASADRASGDANSTEAISVDEIEADRTPVQETAGQEPSAGPSRPRGRSGAERLAALRQAVGKLRIRRVSLPLERWLMVVGGGLIVAGVAIIILGWYGAAHTPYGFEQVPYLISGGLLGVALTVLGGLFYFAFWLTRQIQEGRRQSDATTAALTHIAELLAGRSNGLGGGGNGGTGRGQFVATAAGTMIHRPDCAVVTGRSGLRRVSADEPGLVPCKLCDPLAAQ